jgi:regulator of RNase E activity RraA
MTKDHTLAPALIETLRKVSTDTITGTLMRIAGMRTRAVRGVRPVDPKRCTFIGPAYTVRYVPLREDLAAKASVVSPGSPLLGTMDAVPAGSVVVMDMGGDDTSGAIGDVIMARLITLGVAGVVVDGGMRDGMAITAMTMPVWCRAIAAPPSPRSLMAVGVQEVIGCGGVMVEPGDVVVADGDGVAVIPRHLADEVARDGAEHEEIEVWIRAQIEKGAPLRGLYPPTDEVFARWRRERK